MKSIKTLISFSVVFFMLNHVFSQSIKFEKINWNDKQVDAVSDFINVQLKDNFNENSLIDFLSANGLSLDTAPDIQNFARIRIDQKTKSLLSSISELQKSELFVFVEPDFIIRASLSPNDTYYSSQYALPKVDAPNAWDITTGEDNIIIGVLDSGIPILDDTLSHPDLMNNSRIIKGSDYIGDGNGVKDERGHGTHVAGIIGAETNNSTGIAGINWNSKLRINQVFDINGSGSHSGFRNALINAVNNGCKIINFSGGSITGSWYMENAVQYAQNNNVLLVAAAGNYHSQNNPDKVVEYPAAYSTNYDNVIAVSSTTSSDVIASSSSRGSEVVVSAPGDQIYSTLPNYVFYYDTVYGLNQNYDYLSGTSMATPLVAGLTGLMLSLNPDLPPDQTREILEDYSEDLGTSGFDTLYGYGRIDAFEALKHTPTWNNVIKNDMYGYNGGSIKYQSTSYTSPYTIPEYLWQQNVQAINQSYGGIDYVFSHWSDGEKNSIRHLELANNGQYSAMFKGHFHSLSITSTSTGGSRKIWSTEYWDPEENPVGHRVVYEDNGDVYYTEYRYQNISGPYYYWTDEELISDGSGNSKYPSLAVAQLGEYCIVWQQYDVATGKYKIIYREFNTGNPETPHVLTSQSTSNISRPVVSVTSGTMGFSYGRYWHFLWDNGNGLKFAENEYQIYDVPNTNSSSHNPTITNDPNIYNGIVAYAWEQSGNIYFQKLNFQGVPVNYPVENLTGAYSSIESCSDPSIALMSGDIMVAFHAKTLYMPISKTFVKPPPPQLYDEIYARRHDGNNWGTLNTLFIANTEGQTPAVGSVNYDDFSVMWKVKNQNLLAKLDYVGGTGWDLYSTVETYTANNIKNPTLSTASSDISALWSEGTSPFSVHHEELVNPSKRKIEKLTTEKGHSANNRIYRKAEFDFSKMNPEAEGYLTLRMSETTDENNTPFLLFRNDSLTAGSFLSSPYFAPTLSNTVLKIKIQLFGARLNLPANLINTNQTLFRISVLGEKTNYPLQIIKDFSLKNIKPDSAGIYYFDKTFAINTANFMGRQIRIDIELLPGNWTTYQPSFIEEFELEGGGAKLIASEQNDIFEPDKSGAAESLLLQAWPNPFNPVTNITFVLSKPSKISLRIYDIRGRVVANLFEGRKDAGKYTIKFDGSNLSSGVYFYEMINENQKEIRKIMLVK